MPKSFDRSDQPGRCQQEQGQKHKMPLAVFIEREFRERAFSNRHPGWGQGGRIVPWRRYSWSVLYQALHAVVGMQQRYSVLLEGRVREAREAWGRVTVVSEESRARNGAHLPPRVARRPKSKRANRSEVSPKALFVLTIPVLRFVLASVPR